MPNREQRIAQAIKGLWAAEEIEREAAKLSIIRLGQRAVPSLMAVLRDLQHDPTPRYAPGREEEATRTDAEYRSLLAAGRTREASAALEQLMNLRVNWRLKRDVCELLGRLKAEEAISILIEAMEDEDSIGSWEITSPPMHALIEMGGAAVPRLLEAMETAEARVFTRQSSSEPPLSEEARTRIARIELFQIQARSSIVLGQIGDARALPVLERVLGSTNDSVLIPYLRGAIAKIRTK